MNQAEIHVQDLTGPTLEGLKKLIKKHQFQLTAILVSVPLIISGFNAFGVSLWKTSLVVLAIMAYAIWVFQKKNKLQQKISEMSYQLSVGSKLYRKPKSKGVAEIYFIFQEGHRYYYLENQNNGEKRLVSKDRILSDFDLIY